MVKNESRKTQKLIIPQGTIDSMDTTIIEIPAKLHGQPIVVAKRKDSQKSMAFDFEEDFEHVSHQQQQSGSRNRQEKENAMNDTFRSYGKHTNVDDPRSSSTLRDSGHTNRGEFGYMLPRTGRGAFEDDQFGPTPMFPSAPSRPPPPPPVVPMAVPMAVPTASQMTSRYNFQANIPPQSFRITCDVSSDMADQSPDINELEKAEKVLILNELQKYHEARRKYLNSVCEPTELPRQEVARVPSSCRKPACKTCDPPAPLKSCLSTTRSETLKCQSYHRSREPLGARPSKGGTTASVGCDPCPADLQRAPQGRADTEEGRPSGSKQGEEAEERMCVPTLLTTCEIMKIRQQFQEATKKLEKAMSCMPCNSNGKL